MSQSPSLLARARVPFVISVSVILLTVASVWPSRQQAGSSLRPSQSNPVITAEPDKAAITPAASTITVNSLADAANGTDGLCTLREAITAANTNTASGAVAGECAAGSSSGSDTINFSVTGTINLTGALPDIVSNMTINGPGSSQLTVRRNTGGFYRNFNFTCSQGIGPTAGLSGLTARDGRTPDGGTPEPINFNISTSSGAGIRILCGNVTMTDVVVTANQTGTNAGGGGILNAGNLTMTDCAVTGNHTGDGSGGGIASLGTLTMTNCLVSGNSTGNVNSAGTSGAGGGIYNSSSLTLVNTTISNNSTGNNNGTGVGGSGGGIYFFSSADGSLINCTISGNATGANVPSGNRGIGGGIYGNLGDFNTKLLLTGSTVSGNTGLGIRTDFRGVLVLTNSTVSGNHLDDGVKVKYRMVVTNSTITANDGTGLVSENTSPTPSIIRNSIVAGNGVGDVGFPGFSTGGHNLIGVGIVPFADGVNGDQAGTMGTPLNPHLGPLANNGGPTQTHALLSNSTAIDAGDNCVADPAHCGETFISQLITDQRGSVFARLIDGPDANTTATVDIGAYEMQTALSNLPDTTTNEDTQLIVPFDGGDTSTITSVTATSSNTTLVPNDASHLSVAITGSTGAVTINPATNQFGATNITVTINRTGGSESKTFLLTVNPVNDAPSFTKGPDQTVNEDAGAQTVANWATSISQGPNESGQTLTFQVTGNTNAALFSAGPAISSTGTLTYTTVANANGSATVTINLKDNGGTASGGADTSASQTFAINVNPVNDVPSFTKGPDQTVNHNAGAQSVPNWATNISAGPADESGQTLTFQVTGNTSPALFSAGPAISSTGTLTYTPAGTTAGTATITINLKDNGGTANGGVDTTPSQTFNITVTPPSGGFINFSAATNNTTESSGFTTLTVKRTGDLSRQVTVDYASSVDNGLPCSTANGAATPKCDFTLALGTIRFAPGEDTKTVTVLISQDSFVEGPETFTVSLSNPTNLAALGPTSTSTTTITDDVPESSGNVIDDARNFVRQHYHDFLNREPDPSGWDFWTGEITSCGGNAACIEVKRINVSAAFFLSIEFQNNGYLVERFYKVAYGDATGNSRFVNPHQIAVPIVRASEFFMDTQRIGRGVVVLQPGWEQALENNKQAYALEFVQTARFVNSLPTNLTPSQFVDRLNQNTGGVLSLSERQTVINLFGGAQNSSNVTARAQAIRMVADDQDLFNGEFNRAFVLAEYFGYLRRNPNDAPELNQDYTGYDFWLTKLNERNGNYIEAEMVKAFLASDEYRQRFGS